MRRERNKINSEKERDLGQKLECSCSFLRFPSFPKFQESEQGGKPPIRRWRLRAHSVSHCIHIAFLSTLGCPGGGGPLSPPLLDFTALSTNSRLGCVGRSRVFPEWFVELVSGRNVNWRFSAAFRRMQVSGDRSPAPPPPPFSSSATTT